MGPTSASTWVVVTNEPLSSDELSAWALRANCGAVVTFTGVVRDHSRAHSDVLALEYETSPAFAERRLNEIVTAARERWTSVEAIAIHHRIGRVELSEATVIVAVSSPHRSDAFDAARFCIDTLKQTVPMWKREIWEGGSAWSEESSPLADVPRP
ncbi:MAG TPA: molybdenum cofactor biosynthesis protein MoaE [Acidimicrobiales bacterium]|nr:molybdenum cofactor biosynthesis protein MoaE [Acidimicrobiales bacterium]